MGISHVNVAADVLDPVADHVQKGCLGTVLDVGLGQVLFTFTPDPDPVKEGPGFVPFRFAGRQSRIEVDVGIDEGWQEQFALPIDHFFADAGA